MLNRGTPLQGGKWLKVQALLEISEMEKLFETVDPFFIFSLNAVYRKGEETLDKSEFLRLYGQYVQDLKRGETPKEDTYRSCFSSAFSVSVDHFFALPLDDDRYCIQIAKPVIQLQAHRLDYSLTDGKFRSMVFGADSITWGLQFSYPQILQDPITKRVEQIKEEPNFPNTALFHKLQRWMRECTIPTPFLVENKRTNVPIRLGKECLSWINRHAQLKKKGIQVYTQVNSKIGISGTPKPRG